MPTLHIAALVSCVAAGSATCFNVYCHLREPSPVFTVFLDFLLGVYTVVIACWFWVTFLPNLAAPTHAVQPRDVALAVTGAFCVVALFAEVAVNILKRIFPKKEARRG